MLTTGKTIYATTVKLTEKKISNICTLSTHVVLVILDPVPCLKSLLTCARTQFFNFIISFGPKILLSKSMEMLCYSGLFWKIQSVHSVHSWFSLLFKGKANSSE